MMDAFFRCILVKYLGMKMYYCGYNFSTERYEKTSMFRGSFFKTDRSIKKSILTSDIIARMTCILVLKSSCRESAFHLIQRHPALCVSIRHKLQLDFGDFEPLGRILKAHSHSHSMSGGSF